MNAQEARSTMTQLARVLALVTIAATYSVSAKPGAFADTLTFEGVVFSRQGTGELKARALLTSVTICEFAKYEARDNNQSPRPRLLVLRFARKLSVDQLKQVFRGVVEGKSGYSEAELKAFLDLLPSVAADSLVNFRADSKGALEVFAGSKQLGSVASPQLVTALWAGLGTDT